MTLTLENPELEARLLEEAIKRGLKPEEIALETLQNSFVPVQNHDADFLIGIWNETEYQDFLLHTKQFEQLDTVHER